MTIRSIRVLDFSNIVVVTSLDRHHDPRNCQGCLVLSVVAYYIPRDQWLPPTDKWNCLNAIYLGCSAPHFLSFLNPGPLSTIFFDNVVNRPPRASPRLDRRIPKGCNMAGNCQGFFSEEAHVSTNNAACLQI